MMNFQTRRGVIDPARAIDAFIDRHGAWRVLRAALWAVVVGRPRRGGSDIAGLDDRMRRDIGLPPATHDPRDPVSRFADGSRMTPPRQPITIRGLD